MKTTLISDASKQARADLFAAIEKLRDRYLMGGKGTQTDDIITRYGELQAFADSLRQKYPDHIQYMMWSIVGMGTAHLDLPHLDFPNGDSVVKFIKKLGKKKKRA